MTGPLASFARTRPGAQDDEVLASMYADLSGPQASDPASFRSRVAWWRDTLAEASWQAVEGAGSVLVAHMDDHTSTRWASPQIGRPVCLSIVVDTLAQQGEYVRVNEFLTRPAARGWTQTLRTYVVRPAWRWLTARDEEDDEATWPKIVGDWVIRANVERAAHLYLAQCATPTSLVDAVMTQADLEAQIRTLTTHDGQVLPWTPTDIRLLCTYLERDAKALVRQDDTIKWIHHTTFTPTIGEQEHGIMELKRAQKQLSQQIDTLESRLDNARASLQRAVQTKQPESVALSYLRTKKQMEELLTKRVGALQTVQQLLVKLEQAVGDAAIMQTYETSAKTLRAILSDPALQQDRVEKTMDALSDALAMQDDVQTAMTTAAPPTDIDEDELAAELEALTIEKQQEQEQAQEQAQAQEPAATTLPSAPQHTPASATRVSHKELVYENSA